MKKNALVLLTAISLVPMVAAAENAKVVGKPGTAAEVMASQPKPKMPPPPKRDKDGRPIIDMVAPKGSDSAKAASTPSDKTSVKDSSKTSAKSPTKTSGKAPAKKSAR